MLAFNELPRFNNPLFTANGLNWCRATSSRCWIGSTDPKFSETETRKLLESIGGAHIEIIRGLMRYLLYSILVIVAITAAAFAIVGIPGHLSAQAARWRFSPMDRQAKLRPEKPLPFHQRPEFAIAPAGTVGAQRAGPHGARSGLRYQTSVQHRRVTGTTNFVRSIRWS